MSKRVFLKTLKTSAAAAVLTGSALALAGCSTFGMSGFSDPTVTGSVSRSSAGNLNQPMPSSPGASMDVAQGPFTPPENVGGVGGGYAAGYAPRGIGSGGVAAVTSQDLPALSSSANGTSPAMSAQPNFASEPSTQPSSFEPGAGAAPNGSFVHVIESGESIYTIARRYHVTVQAILSANGITSPDKIYVGQAIAIPGRPDLAPPQTTRLASAPHPLGTMPTASSAPIETRQPTAPVNALRDFPVDSSRPQRAETANIDSPTLSPVRPVSRPADLHEEHQVASIGRHAETRSSEPQTPTARTASRPAAQATQPTARQPVQHEASLPKQGGVPASTLQEPAMSGADKFRWPVRGSILDNFAATKGTGIDIAAPEGSPVRAAENGTVIYVGAGVEGYGNLILIRHANGYVSAYAHLKTMNVAKGDVVNRGDAIGSIGMTGSVTRPQLHFELRKGATPVDPVPLLAAG